MNNKRISRIVLSILMVLTLILSGTSTLKVDAASKLNKSNLTITAGKTFQLKLSEASGKVKWTSSDKDVVTVSSKGKIKAKKGGKAVVKAKAGKKTYKCKITVRCKKHSWDEGTITEKATCSSEGEKEYTCEDCGAKKTKSISKMSHDYEKKDSVAATKEAMGYTVYKCKLCGDEKNGDAVYYQPTEKQACSDIIAMKSSYPEGMSWTNNDFYEWEAGIYSGGYGCMGFAMAMSDAAFGKLTPATQHSDLDKLKVGDIIRINEDTHSVVVLSISGDSITIAEGNYNSSIHWGRTLSKSDLSTDSQLYIITRYQ